MLRFLVLFLSFFIFTNGFAENKIKYVIYMTFDGTRWQEIFLDHSYLQTFWKKYANRVNFYGMPDTNTNMSVASIPISLPSYQSQMAGSIQPCFGNSCGRIKVQTLPENIKDKLQLKKQDVAIFASWYDITYSAEHIAGSVFTNTGNTPVYDPVTKIADPAMYKLNMQQFNHSLSGQSRPDPDTFAQAMHYFETYKPRFLWISLNDSDEEAHKGNLEGYHNAIRFFDYTLDEVFTKLKAMNIENETMVIVTTDHGRGNGIFWTQHGPEIPASKQTWAFVMNGNLKPMSQNGDIKNYNTLSIRPTVEAALGVS